MLTLIHRRHRLENFRELSDYCYEQILIRRSIFALHEGGATTGGDRRINSCAWSSAVETKTKDRSSEELF
jgi:hypothetical protein